MATPKEAKTRVANWDNDADRILLDILVEQKVNQDGFANGTFTKSPWKLTLQKFNEVTKMQYTLPNLKNRYKNIKRLYDLYLNLKSRSGWGWDNEKNIPTPGTEDEWAQIFTIDKRYKQCQGKGFQYMEQMNIICATSLARGELAAPSTGASYLDTNDLVDDIEDDDMGVDLGLDLIGHGNSIDGIGLQQTSTGVPSADNNDDATSHRRSPPRTSSGSKRKRGNHVNNDALERLVALGEERLRLTREIFETQQKTSPLMETALNELYNLDGLSPDYLFDAIELMKQPSDRSIFLCLPSQVRLDWIMHRLGKK